MIKINICKGFLAITDENNQIYPGWVGDGPPDYDLPEVDDVYQRCMSRNYSPERIIDNLLYIFHRQRIIRSGFLADLPLVLGLIGPAGGGKSCGGVGIAIFDYMLCGIPVISNMDIEVTVRYKQSEKVFRSLPLDKTKVLDIKHLAEMYKQCCLFVDEINIEYSEARRSMSNNNLKFNYVLQERRKRMLSMIHTEQSEMWADDRTRFSTSLYIKCRDAAYNDGLPQPGKLGRKSYWKIYDTSGVYNGDIVGDRDPRFIIAKPDFHNTPFWHAYDTGQLQGLEDENPEDQDDIRIKDGESLAALKGKYAHAKKIVEEVINLGFKEIEARDLWDLLGIQNDRSMQVKIGNELSGLGIPQRFTTGNRRVYILDNSKFRDNGG